MGLGLGCCSDEPLEDGRLLCVLAFIIRRRSLRGPVARVPVDRTAEGMRSGRGPITGIPRCVVLPDDAGAAGRGRLANIFRVRMTSLG